MSIWDNLEGMFENVDIDSDEIRYTHPNNVSVGFSPGYADINYKDKFGIDTDNRSWINFDGGSVSHDPKYGVRADFQGFGGNVGVTKDKLSYRPSGFEGIGAELSIDKWGDIGFKGDPLKGTDTDIYLNRMLDEATGEFQEKVLDNQFKINTNLDTTNLAQAALGQGTFDNVISGNIISTDEDQVGWGTQGPIIGGKSLPQHGMDVVNQLTYPFTNAEEFRKSDEYKNMHKYHPYKLAERLGITPIVNENASYENLEDVFSGAMIGDDSQNIKYEHGVPSYNYNKNGTYLSASPDAFEYASPNFSASSDGVFSYESPDNKWAVSNEGLRYDKFNAGFGGNWSIGTPGNVVLSKEGLAVGPFGKAPSSGPVWQPGDPVNTDLGLSSNIITSPDQLTPAQIEEWKKLMGNI